MSLFAAAAIDIVKDVSTDILKRFFQPKTKKEQDVVSVGLAVGYFYNFLEPLNNVLANNVFELYTPGVNEEPSLKSPKVKYTMDNVTVEVIIPKRLDGEAKASCEKEFKDNAKGYFYLPANSRFYGINYRLSKTNDLERLTIVDFARPALAAKRYYEEILGMRTFNEEEKWFRIQLTELTAFKTALTNLQKLGYGVLINKLYFKEIG